MSENDVPEKPEPLAVRLDPGTGVAAALPHLLGFAPQESLVLVALTGPASRRVGVTLRVDLPPPGREAQLVEQAVRALAPTGAGAAVVVVVTEAPDDLWPDAVLRGRRSPVLPGRELLGEVVRQFAVAGVAVQQALLLRDGRCWDYDCAQSCCHPGAGRPLPTGTSPLAAATAFTGQVVAADRAELVDRLVPVGGPDAREVALACSRVGAEQALLLAERGWDDLVDAGWQDVLDAVARCTPGRLTALPADDVARVGWALVESGVRDRALPLGLGPDAAAAEALWTQLTRRLPAPLDAAPALLLAVSAWARGDGTTAATALDRALDSRPDLELGHLLRSALDAAVPPADLRRLLAAASGDAALRAGRAAASPPRARGRRGTR